jgi:hypothetical protein
VDFTGGPPGSCAIDRVRVETVPSFLTLVCVLDWLQTPPPSFARARACPWFALGLTLDRVVAFSPAALPPTPIEDDVPAAPVEVPAVPTVDADVPPLAALPPLPTVAADESGDVDAPPVAAPLADCAITCCTIIGAPSMQSVAASGKVYRNEDDLIVSSYFLSGST